MRYKYDAKTDILMIELGKGKPDFGEQNENIITHYNKKGLPIEIEILDASKTVAKLIETMFKKKGVQVAMS
jgi:uncharacterized protein YuzE